MIKTLADAGFKWIDILDPTQQELHQVSKEYGIHEALVADVLQPEHLPKYEPAGKLSFFILRYYSESEKSELDTIQGLTNKIAIFCTDDLVITIHRVEIDFIKELKTTLTDTGECKGTFHLLNRLIKSVFHTFEAPANCLAKEIDNYESQTFLKKSPPTIFERHLLDQEAD